MKKFALLLCLMIAIPLVGNAQETGTGNHFKINVPQAGLLKQRLEYAVLDNSDEDSVDSLTVKGKIGGDDLKYLVEAQGILSELTYLDLSQVELVYDNKEYLSTSSAPGLYWATINHYLFSAENRDESRNYLSGGKTVTENTYYRNDFACAFKDHKKLKDCRLPKSMPGVGDETFNGCEALEKVVLPDRPTYIGNSAFKGTALKTIELPTSVEKVGDYAFAGMPIENIDLSHVRSFGKGCLKGTSIKNIQLADGMESIPEEMFSTCWELTSVVIPSSVKSICNKAFEECNNLETVSIPGSVESIGDEVFWSCDNLKTVNIAEGVKKMGSQLFQECWSLESISLPSTIEEIGHLVFPKEWILKTTLPFENGIWYIGKVAYALEIEIGSPNNHTSLNFKEGTISIADEFERNAIGSDDVVNGLEQIKTISLPTTLRRIGNSCFYGTSISSITLPDALEYIGKYAFNECKKLKRITIPENVKYLGPEAFEGSGLMRVYYNAIEADVEQWVMQDGSVDYDSDIFSECPLVRVYIGEGVKKIPAMLFARCSSLARVQMASTVETIGAYAFAGCTSLEHIDLPSSLKEIGNDVLPTSSLNSVACYMKEPIDLGSSDEDLLANEDVYRNWQEAMENGEEYYYGLWYPNTILGSTTGWFRIDANGQVSWGYWKEFNSYYLGKEVLENEEVVRLWQEAMDRGEEYYYGTWYVQTEEVGDVECYYRIDAGKNVSFGYWKNGEFKVNKYSIIWTDKVPSKKTNDWDSHLALLQVPKGLLSYYQSHPLWAALTDKIEAFDAASDAEPVNQTTTVNISESVKEDTDLCNTMLGNVYVTLDTEDSGDGYNATEGCIVINSTTSEEGLAAATADDADDLTVKNLYNGLILEVPGGKGKIIVDCQTLGQNVVFVKIGDAAPQKITTDSRQQLSVPYDVKNNTHVYIYAAKAPSGANSNSLRAAYANDDAVKLYGLTVQVDSKNVITGDVNGDGTINAKDVLAIVNKILGKPDADFNEKAADVNKDGVVNIADVIGVKNIIFAY